VSFANSWLHSGQKVAGPRLARVWELRVLQENCGAIRATLAQVKLAQAVLFSGALSKVFSQMLKRFYNVIYANST